MDRIRANGSYKFRLKVERFRSVECGTTASKLKNRTKNGSLPKSLIKRLKRSTSKFAKEAIIIYKVVSLRFPISEGQQPLASQKLISDMELVTKLLLLFTFIQAGKPQEEGMYWFCNTSFSHSALNFPTKHFRFYRMTSVLYRAKLHI